MILQEIIFKDLLNIQSWKICVNIIDIYIQGGERYEYYRELCFTMNRNLFTQKDL